MAGLKPPQFNGSNLYDTRVYTDRTLGTITHNVPVVTCENTGRGMPARDPLREDLFEGSTVIHTTNGPMNISFPIPATSLHEAVSKFNEALETAFKEMQARALRNKIITGGGPVNGTPKIIKQ